MDKITIIFRGYTWPGTLSPYQGDRTGTAHAGMTAVFDEYFNFVHYDSTQSSSFYLRNFDPSNTVIITQVNDLDPWWQPLTDAGYRMILSSVTETLGWSRWRWPKIPSQVWGDDPTDMYYATSANPYRLPKGTMILTCPNWFWYSTSLTWLGWSGYPMNYTHQKKALVPIGRIKKFRDYLYDSLVPYHDEVLMSYTDRGIQFPDDLPMKEVEAARLATHVNTSWYENTTFSIVAESWMGDEPFFYPRESVFVTEKTFKPMAHQHPFMILGMKGTLAYLKSQGFKTFDNLFDESYDLCDNWKDRCDIIVDNFKRFKKIKNYDAETWDRIQYNHRFYYSRGIVEDRLRTQIAQPIIDYVRAQ